MKSIALSTFDTHKGPIVHFLLTDGFMNENEKEAVSNLLNFNIARDFFIFYAAGVTSYNIQFEINSDQARGKRELLMLSLVTDKFPTRKTELAFSAEAKEVITFLKKEPFAEFVFHLDKDYPEAEFTVVKALFEKTMAHLRALLDRCR
jgi:hypothetical protein